MKRIVLVLCWLIPIPAQSAGLKADVSGQNETPRQSIGLFPPLKPAPVAAGVGAAVLGSALLDRTLRDHLFPYRRSDPSEDLRHLGDIGQVSGPLVGTGFLLQGLIFKNQKSQDTGILTYETFVVAGAAGGLFKFFVGRKRPEATDNPFHFKPGGSDSSFPSGHTTEAFAAATVFSEQYPHWYVAIPAYGAASAIGFSRMYANKHWLSDVVAGAALGTITSHLLWARLRRRRSYAWEFSTDGSDIKLTRRF